MQPHPQQPREKVKLGNFSETKPRDFKTFRIRAEEAKHLNQWTDADAKSQVKIAMIGPAAALAQDIQVGADPDARMNGLPLPGAKTYLQYMAELQDRFVPLMESQIAIARFPKLRQEVGESLADWHVRVKEEFMIAFPGVDPETSPELRRQFCHYILDIQVSSYLIDQNPQLFRQCLTIAQTKQGNIMQVRMAAKSRLGSGGRMSAMVVGKDGRVGAINYPIGTDTPTTTEANKRLRRGGASQGEGDGQRANAMARKDLSCHICHDPTHFKSQCPYREWYQDKGKEIRKKNEKKPVTQKKGGTKGKLRFKSNKGRAGAKGPFRVSAMGTEIECGEAIGMCDPIEADYITNAAWINEEDYEVYEDSEDEGN